MINTDKYEGHRQGPWSVRRGQRNTVLIESTTLGCSDCGSADIHTYENTNGEEIQFPHSVEPAPFTLSPDKYHGKWQMYCPSCDLLDYAEPIDATQNDADFELIADAPLLLEEVKRLRHELLVILSDFQTRKTDMYEMRNRIETILKGGEEE